MRQAMEFDPALLACAEEPMKSDNELLLMAYGSPENSFGRYMKALKYSERDTVHARMKLFVSTQLQAHQAFCSVLNAMKEPGSFLSTLEQGDETQAKCMKSIAEFLGVFTAGEPLPENSIRGQLDLLLRAKANVKLQE